MKLSTRLLLLIVGCLLPILGAQVYSQVHLSTQRQDQVATFTLRQAELTNSDIASILEGVASVAAIVAELPEVRAGGNVCDSRLTALLKTTPSLRFLAVTGTDGRIDCASDPALTQAKVAPGWMASAPGSGVGVGSLAGISDNDGAFLPIFHTLAATTSPDGLVSDEPKRPRQVVAALDLQWLNRHLDETSKSRTLTSANSTVILVDRNGIIAGRFPDGDIWLGRPVPDSLKPVVNSTGSRVTTIASPDGDMKVVAFVPVSGAAGGLSVIESSSIAAMSADLQRASERDLWVIGLAGAIALILAWLAGRRFIYLPTESLLRAARRWRDGDLTVRATPMQRDSEFAALAQSFNDMAATLETRELERRIQSQVLEMQVAARTRELSDSNNRLQVEIAEREKTETALHQAQKLQAVGQLAGGIAHDFNNMLATVLGNLELMERRVAQTTDHWTATDAERLTRLIERAIGAVQRGSQLTSQLLAFSRRQRLSARPTDLNRLVTELIILATSTLGRRVRVNSNLASDLWSAMVDPSQVEAAILNLCLNARDAMPEGGSLTITTSNEMIDGPRRDDDVAPGQYVSVCIADTGVGMTDEIRRRAFDPFFTTKGPGGSGLGLSQVYGVARQSGGSVLMESSPGKGTSVTLLLPRAKEQVDTVASDVSAERSEATPQNSRPGELVLVVDDDLAVRQVTVEMLRDLGFEIAQASGGPEALDLLDNLAAPPCIALLDYAMPGMNGLQLARRLRERGIEAPIGLVTGYAELAEADTRASPLDGLLRKPFTIRELNNLVVQLLAKSSIRTRREPAAVGRA